MSPDRRSFVTGLSALASAAGLPSIAACETLVSVQSSDARLQRFKAICSGLNNAQLRVLIELMEHLRARPKGTSDAAMVSDAIGKLSALRE